MKPTCDRKFRGRKNLSCMIDSNSCHVGSKLLCCRSSKNFEEMGFSFQMKIIPPLRYQHVIRGAAGVNLSPMMEDQNARSNLRRSSSNENVAGLLGGIFFCESDQSRPNLP
ncbi:unnamed protein product [Amoebophrya sp. A120]|nr:unnamed protein product [Amoebophrya sp. A120]|eukprot:GSA120T00021224001.1